MNESTKVFFGKNTDGSFSLYNVEEKTVTVLTPNDLYKLYKEVAKHLSSIVELPIVEKPEEFEDVPF